MIIGRIAILIISKNNKILEITVRSLTHSQPIQHLKEIKIFKIDGNTDYQNNILNALFYIKNNLNYKFDYTLIVQNNTFFKFNNYKQLTNDFFSDELSEQILDETRILGIFKNNENNINTNIIIVNNHKLRDNYFIDMFKNINNFKYNFNDTELLNILQPESFFIEDSNYNKNVGTEIIDTIFSNETEEHLTFEILELFEIFKNSYSFTLSNTFEIFNKNIYFQKNNSISQNNVLINDIFLFLLYNHFEEKQITLKDIILDNLKRRTQYIKFFYNKL